LTFIGYACKKQGKMAKAQSVWSLGLEKCRHKISDIEVCKTLVRGLVSLFMFTRHPLMCHAIAFG
jgi:hypothetical protein